MLQVIYIYITTKNLVKNFITKLFHSPVYL